MERIINYISTTLRVKAKRIGTVGMLPLFLPLFISFIDKPADPEVAAVNTITIDKEALTAIKTAFFEENVEGMYAQMGLADQGLSYPLFQQALIGYLNLQDRKELGDQAYLTIADFEKPSSQKRLWILDLENRKVLYHTYVAHGRNSGDLFAKTFSNQNESFMSSVGFYVTGETYFGKHGLSLKLMGKDKNFNDMALNRNVVMHGADYVSEEFIKQHGRLGRSHGCPAIPENLKVEIISLIKDGSCLFLHGAQEQYASEFLNSAVASENFYNANNPL